MQPETSIRDILTNHLIREYKMHTSSDFWQNYVTGDRWSQHLSLELHTTTAEISTGRGRKFWIYLQPQLWDGEWYAQTLLVGETRCHELFLTVRASPTNEMGWVLRVVAQSRKSHFVESSSVPDVHLLVPPAYMDDMKCGPSQPPFPDANCYILSYCV